VQKLVGLEEHVVWPGVVTKWSRLSPKWRDLSFTASTTGDTGRRLAEVGPERLEAMDRTGLDMQVLSLSTPGVQNLSAADATTLQSISNDALAETVRARPDCFGGFAALATSEPASAAKELERAIRTLNLDGAMIFGRTRAESADSPSMWPIYEVAAALRAPLYLHPATPPHPIRFGSYDGFGDAVSAALATHRLGWHYDTGVQLIRLILSGVLDRFPDLQIIVGHWGEMVLFYLERLAPLEAIAKLPRPLIDYFRSQVYVTPSGMQSDRYLAWAMDILGPERIMFSTDYPFEPASTSGARTYLTDASLDERQRELIASENWNQLRSAIRR